MVDGAGYTVQGVGGGTGIDLSYTNNVTLQNVQVSNFSHGISLTESSHNTITGNTASNNTEGIFLYGSSYNNTISGNTALKNGDGIFFTFGYNNTITGNTISNNTSNGIQLYSSNHNTIAGNTALNNPFGIFFYGSSYNTIAGNTASNNTNGIHLLVSSNNDITGNVASNNDDDGILLDASSNNTISGNNITGNNNNGIFLDSSSNNTISGNKITDSTYGISVDNSSNNIIAGNNITRNGVGIWVLSNSRYNTVTRNNIDNNFENGITVQLSILNTFVGNNITRNSNYGVFLYAYINDNTFYHNNFLGNTYNVGTFLPSVHVWDDGVEGNHWSSYTGVDLNHDGIGDTPHVIDANNTDNYPLMGMFHSFNTSIGEYVNVVSNSTIESFQHFESNSTIRIHVSNMTVNQTHGFCRISIPYEVMAEPFSVTIDGANPTYWNYTLYDNGTHRWIYFEYEHTTREIVIIPEFPSFIILPLFIMVALLAVIIYKRKYSV